MIKMHHCIIINIIPIIITIIITIITHLSFSSIEGYQRTYDHPHREGDPLKEFEVIDEGFEHFHLYQSKSLRKIISIIIIYIMR
jgi:hypothetical protein